jgi:hypothetical protein
MKRNNWSHRCPSNANEAPWATKEDLDEEVSSKKWDVLDWTRRSKP